MTTLLAVAGQVQALNLLLDVYKRQLDDYVEHLDAEYVRFADGTCCNVVDYQSTWSFKEQCGIAPFYKSGKDMER